jgi:2-polyprenyl-3-methyl-5-hydroxy-6-metoxy-1,4-benzoquinol methylase
VPHVVALDIDEPVLGRARSRFPKAPITWRHGDVLTDDLECGFFDAVVSNATLHHLGEAFTSLRRLGTLVRPGGVLAVVTFPCMQWRDLPWGAASFLARTVANRVRGQWEHTASQSWPPPATHRQLQVQSAAALRGAHTSRLPFGRCLIYWQRPLSTERNVVCGSGSPTRRHGATAEVVKACDGLYRGPRAWARFTAPGKR